MNIVLVDDTADHLELLSEFIRELRPCANVHPLRNGQELPQYLEQVPADLVMMDLLMPTINGMDLVREVRARGRWSNLPIVAVSGYQSSRQGQLHEAGFNDFIVKPYDIEDLLRVLDTHLPNDA